jgi:hypothetical protein
VATNAAGYLPNDIIAKAQNADTLDGLDSAVFARAALLRGATGAVNEPDNPVHWNQLKGVPTGFADGAVAWSEVANKPAQYPDAATLDGLDSTDFAPTSALGAYATTAALASDAGAVNEADNPVHWKQLTGVPAGFADGQVGWGEVGNMPAGFADGVDNEGVTGVTLTRVAAPEVVMAPGAFGSSMATCPTGSRVTGGGFGLSWEVADFRLTASAPFLDSWVADGVNDDDVPIGLGAYALCLKVEPAEAFTVATQGVPTSVRKDIRSRDH